jgi:hypothetical protein
MPESVLAELNVRHTRRHMPTRRVALGGTYLPTSGAAYGSVLLGAVMSEFTAAIDDEERELVPRLLHDAADGLAVPRLALRYRLQTDTHGLDRSRHRIIAETVGDGAMPHLVLELDAHGRADPQVIGTIMAAAALPPSARGQALRAIDLALRRPGLPDGIDVRRLSQGIPGLAPFAPGAAAATNGDAWSGIPAERRWAMEVLGLRADMEVDRSDVVARFRRLVRLAHPDHGATDEGAAERLAELAEARELLLVTADSATRESAG